MEQSKHQAVGGPGNIVTGPRSLVIAEVATLLLRRSRLNQAAEQEAAESKQRAAATAEAAAAAAARRRPRAKLGLRLCAGGEKLGLCTKTSLCL